MGIFLYYRDRIIRQTSYWDSEVQKVKSLLTACTKVSHAEAINETAIRLKQLYKLKIRDALIASTAIQQNMPLLTYDKDFTRIEEFDLVLMDLQDD